MSGFSIRSLLLLSASLYLLAMAPQGAWALPEQAETCLECHSDPDEATIPQLDNYDQSVHEGMDCTDCHEGTDEYPHPGNPNKVACGDCHDDVVESFEQSPHGQGILKEMGSLAKACAGCHGHAHSMPALNSEHSPVARGNQIEMCGHCHADSRTATAVSAVVHPLDSYLGSIHGELHGKGNADAAVCSDCHGVHDIRPKSDPSSPIAALNIPHTCGRCHEHEEFDYNNSIHGVALAAGVRESPTCTDCHGEHDIRPPDEEGSRASVATITKTCNGCHVAEHITSKFSLPQDRSRTFEDSYHGLAARAGDRTVANCASCHGWHKVLPSADPKSTVHPDNLQQTCGECHPGAGAKFASVKIHEALGGTSSEIARIFETAYLFLIPLVIGSMVLHNTLDLVRKGRAGAHLPPARENPEIHMSVQERLQHGLLVVTFVSLAYSGFALKYPGSWWALPFQFLGGEEGRRIFHRGAAVLFALVCVWHLVWLMVGKEGRVMFKDMLFTKRDLTDPFNAMLFYLGVKSTRPALPRYSYIEKAEYWALVWGTAVMLLTGGILVFHNLALQHFPFWVLEASRIVHYMEAVLACLAIVVWHLYWVMYDPDVYPMNTAWITGKFRHHHRGGAEPGGDEET